MTSPRGCKHVLLEIHSRSIGSKDNIFLLNAYYWPSKKDLDRHKAHVTARERRAADPYLH